jgi:hypothetical protein
LTHAVLKLRTHLDLGVVEPEIEEIWNPALAACWPPSPSIGETKKPMQIFFAIV